MRQDRPITCKRLRAAHIEAHPLVTHVDHALSFLVRGQLGMEHGGSIVAESGMVILVPAGAPHRTVFGSDVELLGSAFCASCLGLDERAPLMSCFRSVRLGALPMVVIPEARRPHLIHLFEELIEESNHETLESLDVMRSLLLLVLAEVRRAPAMPALPSAAREGSLVADALEFIQRHCLESISPKDVAAAVHRTPAHVTTLLRRVTGHSAGQWITEARLRQACIRLAHTDDPIAAIAEHVGWKDKTHFIRQFRKAIGTTPSAWRRTHRGSHPSRAVENHPSRSI